MNAVQGAVQAVVAAGGAPAARLMERLEGRLLEAADGHGALLARHAGDTIAAGGKRLRPLLLFLAAGAPPPESETLLRAAVAVELVHSATLVHDDVLDGSPLRRGRPTVMAAGGRRRRRRPAICCSRARSPNWRNALGGRPCRCSRGPVPSLPPASSCSAPTPGAPWRPSATSSAAG